jgi:hypothetical protein
MSQNIANTNLSALPNVLVSQQLAATETTQYTGPASSAVKLAAASLCNTSGSAVTVSLSVLKSGQTADGTHRVISSYSLAAGDSTVLSELEGHFLGPGDFISAIAGTASAVTFVLSGVVFS